MPEIIVGCGLSDVNRADVPRGLRVPERLVEYAQRFEQRVGSPVVSFELQPEDYWTIPATFPDQFVPRKNNRWWRAVQSQPKLLPILTGPPSHMGMHQPVQGRDALSSNFFKKYEAIEETKQAMDFAQYIGAEYFVLHLTQEDKWNWARHDQMEKALKIFSVFATYYRSRGMSFVPVIETLEYPQFPATGSEAFDLLNRCRRVLPETQIAFDVTHLWSSRNRMLMCGVWPDAQISFEQSLEYALSALWKDIYVYQLGGGWESETHAVPGLHPQEDPFRFPLKLRESHGVYAECGEMDLNTTLELITDFSVRRGRDLRLVLEVFDRDIDQSLEAVRLIRHDLVARSTQPSPVPAPIMMEPARPERPRRAAAKPAKKAAKKKVAKKAKKK
ncbi:MAG: hypothetical protein WCF84_00370 [Anaerolineae bacterium]